jgi:hypothetical protein
VPAWQNGYVLRKTDLRMATKLPSLGSSFISEALT